jgi:uncharacterized protein YecE (DUF72 family)
MSTKNYIGTSGWNYKNWKSDFYPEELKQSEWLSFYQEKFNTVEVNNSFYQLPIEKTLKSWKEAVGDTFQFAVKASRYTTHNKKLKDPRESTDKFFAAVDHLGKALGPVLFQLPPNWRYNGERLQEFLSSLPEGLRYVMEFRDESWINEESIGILEKFGVAFCIYNMGNYTTPMPTTADFVYVRLHGPDTREKYQGSYSGQALRAWADRITGWNKGRKDVYLYFNNDRGGHAHADAIRLKEMLE